MTASFRNTNLALYRGVNNRRTWTLYEDDQRTAAAIASGSVVRFKLHSVWLTTATPTFEIDSASASANGSIITISSVSAPATGSMLITLADMASITAGEYVGMLGYVDHNDSDRWKLIERGIVIVYETLAGETGLT
jgi:hypothetical protein